MADKPMTPDEWELIRRGQAGRKRPPRNYTIRTCPNCGRQISESAYSGRSGNFTKHVTACTKTEPKGD